MDFGGSSSTEGLRDFTEEHPANLSMFTSSDRPSRPSASLATSMATVSRYYTLANITPSSPLNHLGDEYPPLPHNRISATQSIRQTRNNFQHYARAPQLLQSDHNSDIEDRLGAQGLVELSRASSSSPNEATSIIGASYEIFPGQSFRATRGGEKGLKNQSMMDQPSFLKLEQEEGNNFKHSQVLECHSSHDIFIQSIY